MREIYISGHAVITDAGYPFPESAAFAFLIAQPIRPWKSLTR